MATRYAPILRNQTSRRRGFTLIETALAIIIIGTGVLAMVALLEVGTRTNSEAFQLTTAGNLCDTVRERMHSLSFAEVLAEDAKVYSPPLDVRGEAIEELTGWTQQLIVTRVDPARLDTDTTSTTSPMARLVVRVFHQERFVCSMEYLLVQTE